MNVRSSFPLCLLLLLSACIPAAGIPPEVPLSGSHERAVGVMASAGTRIASPNRPPAQEHCFTGRDGPHPAAEECEGALSGFFAWQYTRFGFGALGQLSRYDSAVPNIPSGGIFVRGRLLDRPKHVLSLGASLGLGYAQSDLGYAWRMHEATWLHVRSEAGFAGSFYLQNTLGATYLIAPHVGFLTDLTAAWMKHEGRKETEGGESFETYEQDVLALRGTLGVVFLIHEP